VRKCLFNTRLLFLFPLVLLRNSKVLFARAGDPLIECFGHANLVWLSTNNPACLQWVSSNICNFFSPPSLIISSFDVQVFFAGAQVCDPLIYCVWHVNFGWLSTNNPTRLQGVSSKICNFFVSSHQFCKSGLQPFEVEFSLQKSTSAG